MDIFLERGFEQTTTGDIASAVGMSKRTVYAYYDDKAALFKAAVQRAADRYTVPLETFQAVDSDDLEATLTAVARIRIDNVATPNGIRLQRILSAQSYRYPELFRAVTEQATAPAIDFLVDLFSRHRARGEIEVSEPRRAAVAFLSLVVGGPTRIITSGGRLDKTELEAQVRFTVQLFLNGIRRR